MIQRTSISGTAGSRCVLRPYGAVVSDMAYRSHTRRWEELSHLIMRHCNKCRRAGLVQSTKNLLETKSPTSTGALSLLVNLPTAFPALVFSMRRLPKYLAPLSPPVR